MGTIFILFLIPSFSCVIEKKRNQSELFEIKLYWSSIGGHRKSIQKNRPEKENNNQLDNVELNHPN